MLIPGPIIDVAFKERLSTVIIWENVSACAQQERWKLQDSFTLESEKHFIFFSCAFCYREPIIRRIIE